MRFWDASALVPLCLADPTLGTLRALLETDLDLAVWWASPVECWSAFARLRREGALSTDEEETARARLAELQVHWSEIQPNEEVRASAGRLVRVHPLRSADALQLAAALQWAGNPPVGEIVTLDRRLQGAARLEGLTVRP